MSEASQTAEIQLLRVSTPDVNRRVLAYVAVAALLIVCYYSVVIGGLPALCSSKGL